MCRHRVDSFRAFRTALVTLDGKTTSGRQSADRTQRDACEKLLKRNFCPVFQERFEIRSKRRTRAYKRT
eukprot:1194425-Prorocentrum_minimum.AAC.3